MAQESLCSPVGASRRREDFRLRAARRAITLRRTVGDRDARRRGRAGGRRPGPAPGAGRRPGIAAVLAVSAGSQRCAGRPRPRR